MKVSLIAYPALLAGLLLAPTLVTAQNGSLQLKCGGIGSDESAQWLAETPKHALTVLFAARDGAYLSDVNTEISGPGGIRATEASCGPIAQVEVALPGRYQVKATYAGQAQTKALTLKPGGGGKLVLRWQAD